MKKIFFLMMLMVGLFIQAEAQTASNQGKLSQKDQANSTLFQSLRGQNRLSVYKQLQTLIKVKDVGSDHSQSNRIGVKTTTLQEVITLLGEPDNKIQQTILEYNLSGKTTTYKLVIGISQSGEVQFCTVKSNL